MDQSSGKDDPVQDMRERHVLLVRSFINRFFPFFFSFHDDKTTGRPARKTNVYLKARAINLPCFLKLTLKNYPAWGGQTRVQRSFARKSISDSRQPTFTRSPAFSLSRLSILLEAFISAVSFPFSNLCMLVPTSNGLSIAIMGGAGNLSASRRK